MVVGDHSRKELLATILPEFRCGSDQIGETMSSAPLSAIERQLHRDESDPSGVGTTYGGASSYVGNGGYFELNHPRFLAPPDRWSIQYQRKTGPNNGVFHTASHLHRRQIVDGLSATIAVGERAWYQGSATWVGTANVHGLRGGDSGVCLGRVWWRINELPRNLDSEYAPYLATKKNGQLVGLPRSARNGFGSYHPGGSQFLMADGSVRFLQDSIDFHNTIPVSGSNPLAPIPSAKQLGLFQRMGIRNDSLTVGDKEAAQ